MRTCELHPRAVVVYEVGLGGCPLCAAEDALKNERAAHERRSAEAVGECGGSENLAAKAAANR